MKQSRDSSSLSLTGSPTGLLLRARQEQGQGRGRTRQEAGVQERWGGTRAGAYGAGGDSGSGVKAEKTEAEDYSPQEN